MSNQSRPVVLVTGAGRGIGKGIAHLLGTRGYDIALHYWDNEEDAIKLSQELQRQGSYVELIKGDLTKEGVPHSVVDEAFRKFGRIDSLVNNAGVTITEEFLHFEEQAVDDCYRINFLAPYLCAQRAANLMMQAGIEGTIVNITSVHQERSTDRDSVYGSMKAALARATESMAYELAPYKIRVNAIAPGRIRTSTTPLTHVDDRINDAIPIGRSGVPHDIAQVVAWLLSGESSYVTGITIRVDGGLNLPLRRALIDENLRFF